MTGLVSSAFDSVIVGFVAAAAVAVSDPKVAHQFPIQPLHPWSPESTPFLSVVKLEF